MPSTISFKEALSCVVPLFLFSLFLCAVLLSVANDMYAFVKPDTELCLTIEKGTDAKALADALYRGGVIKNPEVFSLYVSSKGKADRLLLSSGEVTLNASMSYRELLSEILKNTE